MSDVHRVELALERQQSGEKPRVLGSTAAIQRRMSLRFCPHVRPLNELVQEWNTEEIVVPWFDPVEGGVDAEILMLLQSPGPKADREKGSGFISPDNNDMSAQRMWEAYRDVGVPRGKILSWNIIPWYIGMKSPNTSELQSGGQHLLRVLEQLPNLRTVVLLGEKSQTAWFRFMNREANSERFNIEQCLHPRARTFTKRIESSIRIALSSAIGRDCNAIDEVNVQSSSEYSYEKPIPPDAIAVWRQVFERQKAFGEHAFNQLGDEQFFAILSPGLNSCGVIANHLAGNMISRWTDFLITDGEKANRDRDSEFEPPAEHTQQSRGQIMDRWEQGWATLFGTLDSLAVDDLTKIVTIRKVDHPVHAAVLRQIDHYSFHIGQINIIARQLVGTDDWKWFTLAPGATEAFNKKLMGESE